MNDRERLEAILDVVRDYLPPDGISKREAMNKIIGLVDPLPEESQEPVAWIVPVHTHGGDISQKLSWTKSGAGISGVLFEPSERFPLYKSPQKHAWVGLTEQEVKDIFDMDLGVYESIEETMRQLEEINK